MTEQRRVLRKLPKKPAFEYSEFDLKKQYETLTARILDLEAQHYGHTLALKEIEVVKDNHPDDEVTEAIKGRQVALDDLELQIKKLKEERDNMEVPEDE